ncbi:MULTISPECIES: hypothetical protein [unclassified Corynebacterium]|uniref:hypothetical protein n=1 Tax=unclassified Corynebacterium TaxID=2624378 RepID=UPI00309AD058
MAVDRGEIREAIKLLAVGAAFVACGVFLLLADNLWMGAMGIAFGFMGLAVGMAKALGGTSQAARIAMIVGCAAFAVTGALAMISGIVAPGVWGWRSGVSGIVVGALLLGFFGPGTCILIYREYRLRCRHGELAK